MNDPNRGNYIEDPPLSPRAAPATGPRPTCGVFCNVVRADACDGCGRWVSICLTHGPTAAHRCVCAAPASPPPEPAEERCPDCGETPAEAAARWARIELSPNYDPEGAPTPCDHAALRAPALPRPEEPVLGNLTGSATAGDDPRSLLIEPAASAPLPRPEESGFTAGVAAAARAVDRLAAHTSREDEEQRAWLYAYAKAAAAIRALSAPPPGEERLREALAVLVEIAKAKHEWDRAFGVVQIIGISDCHTLQARARRAVIALRAALREDEKGAKP
jgi:hypothetical protein